MRVARKSAQKRSSAPSLASRAKPTAAARRVAAAYEKVKFGSPRSVSRSLAGLKLASPDIAPMLDTAKNQSVSKANQLATGFVAQRRKVGEEREAIRGLMRWSAPQTSDAEARRRIVVRAFKTNKREIFAVHGVSELPPAEAALFMKSYFAEGGSMKAVAEWLQVAGRELAKTQPAPMPAVPAAAARRRVAANPKPAARKKAGLFDFVSDAANAVGDFISDAADTVGDAVSNVVNAVLNAGKSLADAVAAAVSWTVGQITDLVRALISTGKTVAAILTEALAKGAATLKKFVEALIAAGRTVGEVLAWAVAKTATVIKDTVTALLNAGRSIYQIVVWASTAVASAAHKVVQALRDAGKSIALIMADVVRLGTAAIKKMVAAVYAAGQQLGQILVSIAQTALSIARTVLEGLLAVGVTLAQTVASIFADVAQAFRRGLVEGLIALGKSMLEILKAALVAGLSVLALAFAVIMEICGGHRPLTAAERTEARKIFGWSIDLDRVKIAVASIPADLANWANGQRPFTTMYIINFASNANISMRTLIHEMTHVWQAAVAGPVYMVEALHSQFFGRGYEVTAADVAAANGDIRNLEREQQAEVVERYYVAKFAGGSSADVALYEQLARCVFKAQPVRLLSIDLLRPASLPLSRRITGRVPRVALAVED